MGERLLRLKSTNYTVNHICDNLGKKCLLGILLLLIIGSTTLSTSFSATLEITSDLPPKHQIKNGISPVDVECNAGLVLIFKSTDNSPDCVKSSTVSKLIGRGWAVQSFQLDTTERTYYQILNRKIEPQIGFEPPIWILEDEDEALYLVKTYQGEDGKGDSIMDLLVDRIETNFSLEEITDSNSVIGWYGLKGDYRMSNIYDVSFVFKTDNEELVYTWLSDLDAHDIGPRDEITKELMLALDS